VTIEQLLIERGPVAQRLPPTRYRLCNAEYSPQKKANQYQGEQQMSDTALSLEKEPLQISTREGQYKVASTTLIIRTNERLELQSITKEIAAFVEQAGVRDGFVQVSSLHTTAGILMNETQGALLQDIASLFEQVVPRSVYYKHNDPLLSDCDRKNADAHLRAVITGLNVSVPVVDGRLRLGTWQNIILAEFDGPNNRRIHVQVLGV
jgi:secondary thiamine-phosphate synthase enzyme